MWENLKFEKYPFHCEYLPESQEEPYLMNLHTKKIKRMRIYLISTWAVIKYSECLEEPYFMDFLKIESDIK